MVSHFHQAALDAAAHEEAERRLVAGADFAGIGRGVVDAGAADLLRADRADVFHRFCGVAAGRERQDQGGGGSEGTKHGKVPVAVAVSRTRRRRGSLAARGWGSPGRGSAGRGDRLRSACQSSVTELKGWVRPVRTSSTTPVMPARLLR